MRDFEWSMLPPVAKDAVRKAKESAHRSKKNAEQAERVAEQMVVENKRLRGLLYEAVERGHQIVNIQEEI